MFNKKIVFFQRGDACKRASLGVIMSVFVIAAMFGVVTAFVTNQYAHEGLMTLPKRLQRATDDTSEYLDNTGEEVNTLLVTNFGELESGLNKILVRRIILCFYKKLFPLN